MFERYKLHRRLKDLEEVIENLTRLVKSRDLDWEDMRARCKRLLDRTEKAARVVVESEREVTAEENGGEPELTAPPQFSSLSPRQRQITEQILRRRRLLEVKQ